MKFQVICSDPPWEMNDQLKMSSTPRGAKANYRTLKTEDIINLDVKSLAAKDSVLALWTVSAMIDEGLEAMKNWGFAYKQTWIWSKTKKKPLRLLEKEILRIIKKEDPKEFSKLISQSFENFDINNILNFFLGHCFRNTHELALIGTRGKYTKIIKNKSQRSVYLGKALKTHSEKPEELQDRLDLMFNGPKLEMFARRDRPGYICCGLECPSTLNEDIRDSIERFKKMP